MRLSEYSSEGLILCFQCDIGRVELLCSKSFFPTELSLSFNSHILTSLFLLAKEMNLGEAFVYSLHKSCTVNVLPPSCISLPFLIQLNSLYQFATSKRQSDF